MVSRSAIKMKIWLQTAKWHSNWLITLILANPRLLVPHSTCMVFIPCCIQKLQKSYRLKKITSSSTTPQQWFSFKTMFVSKAPSTLIRFQTKTLFCSVFRVICVRTYRFRIVFAHSHYNAVFRFENALYPQCACSNELDACAFQYSGPRNWRHSWFFVVECCCGLEVFDSFEGTA